MISQKAKLHNRFDFEMYDTETGETQYAQAENIVLNSTWTIIGSGSAYFGYIGVGTGSGTLSPTRTTLFSHLALKSAVAVETVYDTALTAHVTKKITFSEVEANGVWTEVGINYGGYDSQYSTHAMITDSEGNPITVNKTNTKIITIYATVFAEVLAPTMGVQNLATGIQNMILKNLVEGSASYNIVFFTSLLTMDGKPSIIAGHDEVALSWSMDVPNKRRYSNLARLAVGSGNYPIRGIVNSHTSRSDNAGGVSLPVSGIFVGKEYTGVAVASGDGVATEFDMPLSFAKPNSETIYVNGVAKTRGTDYTIHYGMKSTETMLLDMPDKSKYCGSKYNSGFTYIEEILELPQPSGAEATVTSIVLKNSSEVSYQCKGYDVKVSTDGSNWVDAGSLSSGWNTSQIKTLNSFTPGKYKYVKVKLIPDQYATDTAINYIKIYATPPATKHINFTSPPASGAAITADFSTEYIAKTSNFVLDVQAEVLYGEV